MTQNIMSSPAVQMAEGYEKNMVGGVFRYWTPLLLNYVPPRSGDQVLDLACGTGIVSRSVLPLVQPNGSVTGLDVNQGMLAVASRLLPPQDGKVTWREGSAEKIPFPDHSFDLVLCQQGFQFFPNRAAAAGEIHRVLRPQGRVGLAVWQGIHTLPLYVKIFATLEKMTPVSDEMIKTGFGLGDPDELAGLLTAAGFHQVDVTPFQQNVAILDPGIFTRMMVLGAVAGTVGYQRLDPPEQNKLLAELSQKTAPVVNESVVNGVLRFPMFANLARGTRV